MRRALDPQTIFKTLQQHGVEFVVVGGVAAVLQGAPLVTSDLDIVHRRTEQNVARLVVALAQIDAYYREHPDRRPTPDPKFLMGRGHHLLLTTAGAMDVLGMVSGERDYEALLPHTEVMEAGDGIEVRVIELEMLITLKSEIMRDKDKMVLPLLMATLEERRRAATAGSEGENRA
jgi:hypothetical protein